MNAYHYEEHPHTISRQHPSTEYSEKLSFNEKIGLRITSKVGTMSAAYIFVLLSLISLPAAIQSQNVIIIVSWVAQTFLQLVLLPIIIVGQNIQAKQSENRAIATYKDAGALLDETRKLQEHLSSQDIEISEMKLNIKKILESFR